VRRVGGEGHCDFWGRNGRRGPGGGRSGWWCRLWGGRVGRAGWLVAAWSGQTRCSGDSVQRGRTGEASAQSITISHSTRRVLGLVQSAARVEEWQTQGMRATDAALLSFGDREVPLSEQRLRIGARTPCKACGCCAKGERGCATGVGGRVTARLACFDAGSGGSATGGRRDCDCNW
jgi:hypothetical protein